MKAKKILAAVTALSLTTVVFASCGDSADSSSSTAAVTTTTAATTTTATTTTTAATEDSAATGGGAGDSAVATDSSADATKGSDSDYTPVKTFEGYDAFLMFGDSQWLWGNWEGQGEAEATKAFGVDADVTGDGEYTVSITNASISYDDPDEGLNPQIALDGDYAVGAEGCVVMCVDILGLLKGDKLKGTGDPKTDKETPGKYNADDLKVELKSIKADGQEVAFDKAKIKYGNIEDNNNCYRIEIYNDYGDTAKDSPIDKDNLAFEDSLEITFSIEGLSE
ncbi:dockerin [Ruminococcus sp.]|uniref:dockerin n=1 Tax=Ruminococcus sp. TaxID=41978 RepID=UPI003A974886